MVAALGQDYYSSSGKRRPYLITIPSPHLSWADVRTCNGCMKTCFGVCRVKMCPDEQLLAGLLERHVGFVSSAGQEEKYRLLHQVRLVHLIFFISVLYVSFVATVLNPNAPLGLLGTDGSRGATPVFSMVS